MTESGTLLDRAVLWEGTAGSRAWLTQPLGGGETRTWTWAEGMGDVRRMAAYLASLRLPPASNVALWSKNCAWWFMADLAIWMAGHVTVPVYPVLAKETLRHILDHSQSRLLFVGKLEPGWQDLYDAVPADLPRVAFPPSPPVDAGRWDDLVAAHEPLAVPVPRARGELATIVYTSGSTGEPKGATVTFGAMHAVAAQLVSFLSAGPDDRVLSYLPLAHVYERAYTESAGLQAGWQVFFAETLDTFLEDLRRARPTLFISVPRLWVKFQAGVFEKVPPAKLERLLRIPVVSGLVKRRILRQLGLDRVRFAGSGSAPIPAEVIAWYRRLGLELLEGYAMTENFGYSHITRPGHVRPGSVGPPLPEVECRLTDEREILVKSPGNTLGYFRDPAQTAELFTADGFVRTGDLGKIDADGQLAITGRVKELFKTDKGKYIAPAPIENALLNDPAVEQCCVTGSRHPQPYALVILSEVAHRRVAEVGRTAVEQELVRHLRAINRDLPAYEQLAFVAVVDGPWLPGNGFLTPTLKLKRARIEREYGPMAQRWFDEKQPIVWQTP